MAKYVHIDYEIKIGKIEEKKILYIQLLHVFLVCASRRKVALACHLQTL